MSDDERKRELKRAYKQQTAADARAVMPLDFDQLESLLDYLDKQDAGERCDHSLRLTTDWAVENDVQQQRLAAALSEFGGYCDCEVLANLDPDAFRQSFR